jgi:transposase-like protein
MSRDAIRQHDEAESKTPIAGSQPSIPCPRCGRSARVIGGSEAFTALYVRCDSCRQTSVAPA